MHGAMRAARVRSPRFTAKIMQLQICMIATDTLNACLRHLSYPPKLRNFWIATLFRSRLAEISSTYIGFSGPCPRAAALALDNGISIGEKRKNAHLHGRNSRAGDVPGSYACYGPLPAHDLIFIGEPGNNGHSGPPLIPQRHAGK